MGLDQYVYADGDLIFQLRKNYLVDDFFTELFYKNEENSGVEFNCESVSVHIEDFREFKKSVLNFFEKEIETIAVRSFFREPKDDARHFFSENLELIKVLEKAFDEGKEVTYSNWW